jgi:hypothetical protein
VAWSLRGEEDSKILEALERYVAQHFVPLEEREGELAMRKV